MEANTGANGGSAGALANLCLGMNLVIGWEAMGLGGEGFKKISGPGQGLKRCKTAKEGDYFTLLWRYFMCGNVRIISNVMFDS